MGMLVLTRVVGERFRVIIGDIEMWVTLVSVDGQKARIGFVAPRDVEVMREELLQAKEESK